MAEITFSKPNGDYILGHDIFEWTPLALNDTGAPVGYQGIANRSVQVEGTFGVGGSITMEGSNDGQNYHALLDKAGAAVTLTAAGILDIDTDCAFIRPNVTAGDGTTSLTATLVVRKNLLG